METKINGVPAYPPGGEPYSEEHLRKLSRQFDADILVIAQEKDLFREEDVTADSIDDSIEIDEIDVLKQRFILSSKKQDGVYYEDSQLQVSWCSLLESVKTDEDKSNPNCRIVQRHAKLATKRDGRIAANAVKWALLVALSKQLEEIPSYLQSFHRLQSQSVTGDNPVEFFDQLVRELAFVKNRSFRASLELALAERGSSVNARIERFKAARGCHCQIVELADKGQISELVDLKPERDLSLALLETFRRDFYESLVDFLRAVPKE